MYSKLLYLRFPRTEVQKPVVCHLATDYNLIFNIMHATIFPRKEGVMVLELSGDRKDFNQGIKYLKDQGVQVENAGREIKRDNNKCTHCGACTAVCPTEALMIQRPEMAVEFNQDKCTACEMCTTACPTRAMGVRATNKIFFE